MESGTGVEARKMQSIIQQQEVKRLFKEVKIEHKLSHQTIQTFTEKW